MEKHFSMDRIKDFFKALIQKLKEHDKKAIIALSSVSVCVVAAVVCLFVFVAVPHMRHQVPNDIPVVDEQSDSESESESDDTTDEDSVSESEIDSESEPESEEESSDSESESETKAESNTTADTTAHSSGSNPGTQGSENVDVDINIGISGGSGSSGSSGSSSSSSGGSSGGSSSSSGKPNLIHTYPNAPINEAEDTSSTVSYNPLRKEGATDPYGIYNRQIIKKENMTPGTLVKGGQDYSTTLIGYDDFLFCGDTFEDYKGTSHYSNTDSFVKKWTERSEWAKSLGKELYIVIIPNKNTIYSDYMPEDWSMGTYRRIDQVVDTLSAAGVKVIDTRESLLAAKAANPQRSLYYKTDTHWNNHGGFIAYQQIMNVIKKDFPNVVVHQRSEYQINYAETFMKDQAYYLGIYDATSEPGPVYTLKTGKGATAFTSNPFISGLENKNLGQRNRAAWGQWEFCYKWSNGYADYLYWYRWTNANNSNAPTMYMLRDSFSVALSGFFKDSFYQSYYNWSYKLDKNEIEKIKADVIIVEIAEKHIKSALAS